MHMGYNNKKVNYEMDGKNLEVVDEEKDLGVIMQNDLKWNSQCTKAVKTANRVLGMIRRSFSNLNKDIALHLYRDFGKATFGILCASVETTFEKRH